MRISHIYDSSYVYHYILDLFYTFQVVNVNDIAYEFDYDKSTVYKLIKKIEYNLETINSSLRLVKIKPSVYKFVKIK
jgi:predicted DNA-binding protein YlxM (UPF0122 family)